MGEVYAASRRMATVHTPTRFYRAIGTRQVEDILRRKPLCDIDDVIQFLTDQGQAEAAEMLREYREVCVNDESDYCTDWTDL